MDIFKNSLRANPQVVEALDAMPIWLRRIDTTVFDLAVRPLRLKPQPTKHVDEDGAWEYAMWARVQGQ